MSGVYYAGSIYLGEPADLDAVERLSWNLPAMDGDRFAESAAVSLIGQEYAMETVDGSRSRWRIVDAEVVDDGAAIVVDAERILR